MDKKKLIGTIVGVTMFAILIAGATYAWFTFSVNVTNGNYLGTTQNFNITYAKGTDIGGTDDDEGVPMLAAGTASAARSLTVSAYRGTNTATGTLKIKLTTNNPNTISGISSEALTASNALVTSGAIKWAVCSGTASASDCTGDLTTGSTGVIATGSITAIGEQVLYGPAEIPSSTQNSAAATTGAQASVSPETAKTGYKNYWVYFWIDGNTISNEHLGGHYSGYIHASATQY